MNLRYLLVALILIFAFGVEAKEQRKEQRDVVLVVGPSGPISIDLATEVVLVNEVKQLIRSSSLDSINWPKLIPMSSKKEWEEVCSEPCVEVMFAKPTSFQTGGGPVTVSAVRISLVRGKMQGKSDQDYIKFGKYHGGIWIKVRNATGVTLP